MARRFPRSRPTIFASQTSLVVVKNRQVHATSDFYYRLLTAPWWVDVPLAALAFALVNGIFASGYDHFGGVAHARPGNFEDAFYFSVETMVTLGYGDMHPVGRAAHVLVAIEVLTGILLLALLTGLVFAKFSVPRARVVFSRYAVVAPMDGLPTLMFRVANERGNHIVEAEIRLVLLRTETTREGRTLFRMRDLQLVRESSPAFVRTWTVMHPITPESPLHGATPQSLAASGAELIATLVGTDSTSSQPLHAGYSYLDDEIRFGMQLADMMNDLPNGRTELDFARFDEVEPAESSGA